MNTAEKLRNVIFKGAPEPKHNPDGSGTRETNPLYHGKYTIEDFVADGKVQTKELMENPERFNEFWIFERKRRCELARFYPEEGARIEAARAKALKRYTGPREWPHGYTLADSMETHVIMISRYFTQYYELSDDKLADAMDDLIIEDARIAARMSADHETVLKAMDEDTEWPEMLEKANRALRIVNRPLMPEIEGKDGLARLAVENKWTHIPYDDYCDSWKNPLPQKEWMVDVKNVLNSILKTEGRAADAIEHLNALGEAYKPLREYIREKHGEDWLYAVRVSIEDLEWSIIEKLDYGENPPETITPEIEQRIHDIIDEFGRPSREAAKRMEERVRQFNERWNAEIAVELESPQADVLLRDLTLSKFSDEVSMPINDFMQKARGGLQQTFNNDGTFERAKDLMLKSTKNKNNNEWLKLNLMTKGYEPPSFAELGFLEQLGAEIEAAIKEGKPLVFTETQLCKRRYTTNNRIFESTRKKFNERMDALSNMKVLIPEERGLKRNIEPKNEAGEYLGKIVGKEQRLIEPTIRWASSTVENEEILTKIYTFENPIPIHYINIWHGEIIRLNLELLQTDPISADKLSPKGRAHYDAEGLQRNKRKKDQLYLDPITYADLKYDILHSIAYAYGFTQKNSDRLRVDLEEAYQTIYREPAPPKSSTKWKDYVKAVYTYFTFLIEKGAIEDYHLGKEFGKNSGTVYIDVDRGKKLLCPRE